MNIKIIFLLIIILKFEKETKKINKKTESSNKNNLESKKSSKLKSEKNGISAIKLKKTKLKNRRKKRNNYHAQHIDEAYNNLVFSFKKYKSYLKNISKVSVNENQRFYDKFQKINKFLKKQKKKIIKFKTKKKKKLLLKAKDYINKSKQEKNPERKEELINKAKKLLGENINSYLNVKDENEEKDKKNLNNSTYLYELLKKTKNVEVKNFISKLVHYKLKNKVFANYLTKKLIKRNYLVKLKYNKLYKRAKNIKNKNKRAKRMEKIIKVLKLPIIQTIKNIIKEKKEDIDMAKRLGKKFLEYAKKIDDNKIKKKIIEKVKMLKEHPSLSRKINEEIILKNYLKKVPLNCKPYINKANKLESFVSLAQKPIQKKINKNVKNQIKNIISNNELNEVMANTFSDWLENEISNEKEKIDIKKDKLRKNKVIVK